MKEKAEASRRRTTISPRPRLPRRKVKTDHTGILSDKTKLLLLAVLVGLLCGCAAILLKTLIHWIQTGLTSWFRTPADGLLLLLYPGIGMLLSLLFVRLILKDDISHGVTKVLQAVSKHESNIKAHNTWSSIAASSVTIGFGGSVGAEAPIVYSGAAIGSTVARWAGLSYKDMTMLLGCGAAAAVAGIFKAPLAGVLFTLEILLFNMSMNAILPLLLSSVTATVVTYVFMGNDVQFAGSIEAFRLANIPFYLILGIFCGFMSLYFIRVTLKVEDRMRRVRSPYVRWIVCALLMGVLIFLFPPLYGEGYQSLSLMLNNNPGEVTRTIFGDRLLSNQWLFLLYFAAILLFKVFATAFTNAGGGVGGTFGPTLVSGGLAGFVIARLINLTGLAIVPEANFVLVGMGGLMAGVMQAPMTAIFLIAEITGGYELLIPLIVTAAVSYGTIRFFERYSIYTKRIAAQGELLTHDNDQAVLTLLKTEDLVEADFTPVQMDETLGDLVEDISKSRRNLFPVLDAQGRFQGVVTLDDVREIMFDKRLYGEKIYTLMKSAPAFVYLDEKMDSVMNKFESTQAWNLPVLDDENKYLGFVSKSKIFSSYRDQLKAVSNE
ncbi:MAG: chloride channel protein [Bacteroidales bacterium]|nr:chloride channel protein [Bacteroidales bacterium]MBQ9398142.1 chloride channel protein [Bacteroidales bacterium]